MKTDIKQGECVRFNCETCNTEFEITLEPRMNCRPEAETINDLDVYCPFCGEESIEVVQ